MYRFSDSWRQEGNVITRVDKLLSLSGCRCIKLDCEAEINEENLDGSMSPITWKYDR